MMLYGYQTVTIRFNQPEVSLSDMIAVGISSENITAISSLIYIIGLLLVGTTKGSGPHHIPITISFNQVKIEKACTHRGSHSGEDKSAVSGLLQRISPLS